MEDTEIEANIDRILDMQRRGERDYDQASLLLDAFRKRLSAKDQSRFYGFLQQFLFQEPQTRQDRKQSAHGTIIKAWARSGPAEHLAPLVFSLLKFDNQRGMEWWATTVAPALNAALWEYNDNFPPEALRWIENRCRVTIDEESTGLIATHFPEQLVAAARQLQQTIRSAMDEQYSRNLLSPVSSERIVASEDKWDLFLCHASEDKDSLVRPLVGELRQAGLKVWYDESAMTLGDRLRQKIDSGLAKSRYGVVILSHAFFSKQWPQDELDGLASREIGGRKVILPIWHRIERAEVTGYSPLLAGRLAVSSERGIPAIVEEIKRAIQQS